MKLTTERQQFAEQNEMSLEFVNWFFDEKNDSFGSAWFIMAAAMWEGWKGRANREAQPVAYAVFADNGNIRIWSTDKGITENVGAPVPLYTAPPAPAVPEEMKRDPDADVFDPGFMNGWNACRAAMLAQHVSGGYKLPEGWKLVPVEPTEEMLRAAYRESGVYSAKAYREMLAAAPEGGSC